MRWLDYIFAARPMLHLPGWSIFLVALHYHHELSGDRFSGQDLLVLCGITWLTAGAMYLNQLFDVESDRINRKLGFVGAGLIDGRTMLALALASTLAGILTGWAISVVTGAIFLLAALLSWLYSAPPIRLKDRPVWGMLANGFAIGFLVALSVMPNLNLHNAGLLGWDNPFYFGLVVSGVYCLTTIPDIAGDAATGKRTVAVAFSARGAACMAQACYAAAAILAWRTGFLLLALLALIALAMVIPYLVTGSQSWLRGSAKLPILLLSLLAGYFYPGYLIFMIVLIIATRLYYAHRFNLKYPSLR